MEIKLSKVDNGYILQVSKRDPLTGQPEISLTIHPTIDDAIEKIRKA